jgi:S-(hydroxymethyl)glutathione dehydrogenase/alcohol dehydrogenase
MKAAVLHKLGGPFSVEEVDVLPPQKGEVRVKLRAAGLCHSDWHFVEGKLTRPLPVILGHEGAGVIEELGEGVTNVRKGQRVLLNWAPSCHQCYYCQHGDTGLCATWQDWRNGTMRDGSTRFRFNGQPASQFSVLSTFTEQTIAPVESIVPIADDIPFEVAALVGCAITTGVGAAINTVEVRPGDSVAVYGCGGVGLSVVQGARISNAHPIIAVDTDPAKEAIAKQFGATHFVLAGDDAHTKVKELTEGRGVDWAFEAVGPPAVQEAAYQAIRGGGALVVVGVAPAGSTTSFPGLDLHVGQKRILGSFFGSCDPSREFPRLLGFYRSGQLQVEEMISKRYRLDQINEGYADMLRGGHKRGVLTFA